jgi:hypothetical protein
MQAHEIRALFEWLKGQVSDTKFYAQSHPDKWERERAYREWSDLNAQLQEVEDLLRPRRVA